MGKRLTRTTAIETINLIDTQHKGNISAAARQLGVAKQTLHDRYKKSQELLEEDKLALTAEEQGFPIDDVSCYWVKTPEISALIKRGMPPTYEDMRDQLIADMDAHSPKYQKVKYESLGSHMLLIDPADIHIGKRSSLLETGEEYDMQTASNRVLEGVAGLIQKSQPWNIGQIILVIGNDAFHIDNPKGTTTSGTQMDTSGLWHEMFTEGKLTFVAIIEMLMQIAPVHVVYCPSNHDYTSGYYLADTLQSWFRLSPDVSFGTDGRGASIAHRKYIQWAGALIGFTHGDGAPEKDLAQLMQFEAREAWGQSKYGYWIVHHMHHKIRKTQGLQEQNMEKDHIGVTVLHQGKKLNPEQNVMVEYMRSPSAADGWHHRNGYVGAPQAIEAFIHDETGFQSARLTHVF